MDYRREIPSFSALTAFESAARHCSFTKAAKELSTSQPAISRHIDNLEKWLDTRLFERSNNRIKLTPYGHRLYTSLVAGFGEIRSAINEISGQRSKQRFTIGCTYDIAHCWIMPKFASLKRALPDIDIHVVTLDEKPVQREFGTDMIICGGRIPYEGFEHALLMTENIFPVCSPSFYRKYRDVLENPDPASLRQVPLLHLSKDNQGWTTWDSWFSAIGAELENHGDRVGYNNYVYLIDAAIAGEGLALGWTNFVARPIESGLLRVAHPTAVETDFGFYAIWSHSNDRKGVIETAVGCLREEGPRTPSLLE